MIKISMPNSLNEEEKYTFEMHLINLYYTKL